jgi:hypothetical protein
MCVDGDIPLCRARDYSTKIRTVGTGIQEEPMLLLTAVCGLLPDAVIRMGDSGL